MAAGNRRVAVRFGDRRQGVVSGSKSGRNGASPLDEQLHGRNVVALSACVASGGTAPSCSAGRRRRSRVVVTPLDVRTRGQTRGPARQPARGRAHSCRSSNSSDSPSTATTPIEQAEAGAPSMPSATRRRRRPTIRSLSPARTGRPAVRRAARSRRPTSEQACLADASGPVSAPAGRPRPSLGRPRAALRDRTSDVTGIGTRWRRQRAAPVPASRSACWATSPGEGSMPSSR